MQAQNVHIKSGRLIDPKSGVDQQADVFVAEGVVQAIGHAPAGFVADRVIDAAGRVVCPGLVDLSARLSSLDSELLAAVAGGVSDSGGEWGAVSVAGGRGGPCGRHSRA